MPATRVPLRLPPGLSLGDTKFAGAGGGYDGANVRFVGDDPKVAPKPQVIGGWEKLVTTALTGICRSVFPWTDNAGSLCVGFGTHLALQLWVGGILYTITPSGLAAGQINGTGGAGYGTGAWDTGTYSSPSITDYFPRTWSFGAYGQSLIANPRGGTIYQWSNDTAAIALALSGAPANVTHTLVTPQLQVMALGCNEESSGDFNPLCIRHSGVRDITTWTTSATNTAREYVLQGGGRIVGGRMIGNYALVWTDSGLHLGTFVGAPTQVWRFDRVAQNCGLIGPNAAAVFGQTAYWMAPSGQYYFYPLGGEPKPIQCSLGNELFDNLSTVQQDKIVVSSVTAFNEIWFSYPDQRDGLESSRVITLNVQNGAWGKNPLARTAFSDAQPAQYPIGVDPAGAAYWHERGQSADGGVLSWFFETADQYLGEADVSMQIQGCKPDFRAQVGPISLTVYTRTEPQGLERVSGPHILDALALKTDFLTSGRLARARFEGSSAPAAGRFGDPVFLVRPRGRR